MFLIIFNLDYQLVTFEQVFKNNMIFSIKGGASIYNVEQEPISIIRVLNGLNSYHSFLEYLLKVIL